MLTLSIIHRTHSFQCYLQVSDEEKQMMADLEAEMEQSDLAESPKPTHNGNTSTASRSNNKPSGGYLPPGAVPSQNGVLSKHAAEFWFPEARNCTCCSGFKHGCGCCKGGVDTCTNPSCLSAEPVASQSEHTPAPISAARSTPVVSKVCIIYILQDTHI